MDRMNTLQPPNKIKYTDVTVKVSRIGNGFQIVELSTNIPFAYPELGLVAPPSGAPVTNVAEHLAVFFQSLEEQL